MSTSTDLQQAPQSELVTTTDLGRSLAESLADSYNAFLRMQNYHWNVEGPFFKPLHDLFEDQYQEMFVAIDDIAERLRTLGFYAPGTFQEFSTLSSVPEATTGRDGRAMVENLIEVHDVVARSFRKTAVLAADAGDMATEDLAVNRVRVHEKSIWMLRSILGGQARVKAKPN